jgi:hypothetical protein
MPRYYFHIKSDDDFVEDPEGVLLEGDGEAREEAIDAAREMLAERVRKGEVIDGHVFDVRDEDGTKVLALPFRDVLRLD